MSQQWLCALLEKRAKNCFLTALWTIQRGLKRVLFSCYHFVTSFKLNLLMNKSQLQGENTDMWPFFKHAFLPFLPLLIYPASSPSERWWTGVYPFDSQQWMGPVVAVWCVCNEKVSVLLHHAKDNFLGVILICLYSTLTCWHVPQVCITHGSFSGPYAEPWETFSYCSRCVCVCVCWMWELEGGFPCMFESLILQVITQQCKLQRGSKEPWPLLALAWPCIRPSCLTLQLTA